MPFLTPPGRLALWSLFWGLLAIFHVTQAIWLNDLDHYPGDLGDGRFNQLVMEHGYQSSKGIYHWDSPGQFHPHPQTLAYSDTHAGTLPIYIALRRISISREEAWQLWFVVVTALNVVAAFRLFDSLGVARSLRGPLVFASAGSATMVWIAGTHMQMLPVFPALLAWEHLVRFTRDARRHRWLVAAGGLAWQFAASPYSGFFAIVITCIAAIVWFVVSPGGSALQPPSTVSAPGALAWTGSALVFTGGISLALLAGRVHLNGLEQGHARSMEEVTKLAPPFSAWFTPAPVHWIYPRGWPAISPDLAEHSWLAGLLPWVLAPFALVYGWRNRGDPRDRWAVVLALGSFLTLAFFTRWDALQGGLWLSLADFIEPLRAFRSSGRVAVLIQFTMLGATALLLTRVAAARSRIARGLALGLGCLVALETVAHHQPSISKTIVRERMTALVQAWRSAGDAPVLVFAPGFTNQPRSWIDLDAWSAALHLHRVTINGYSGGLPSSHTRFAWQPTPDAALEAADTTGVPRDQISVVETLGRDTERRLGFIRLGERPVERLEGFDLQPAGWDLFAPLATFQVDGAPMHQLTPPAEIRFNLPAGASVLEYRVAMRAGSYDHGGASDGVELIWSVRTASADSEIARETLDPLNRAEHRGILAREIPLPAGDNRILVLQIDPRTQNAWDWPIFGGLRVR